MRLKGDPKVYLANLSVQVQWRNLWEFLKRFVRLSVSGLVVKKRYVADEKDFAGFGKIFFIGQGLRQFQKNLGPRTKLS